MLVSVKGFVQQTETEAEALFQSVTSGSSENAMDWSSFYDWCTASGTLSEPSVQTALRKAICFSFTSVDFERATQLGPPQSWRPVDVALFIASDPSLEVRLLF